MFQVIKMVVGRNAGRKKKGKEVQTERCILCHCDTGVKKCMSIDMRYGFINGAGQLCSTCYDEVRSSLADDMKRMNL